VRGAASNGRPYREQATAPLQKPNFSKVRRYLGSAATDPKTNSLKLFMCALTKPLIHQSSG
jgi:hypothetical protein